MARERIIEKKFVERCEHELKATVLKFTPMGSNGWPDRIVMVPPGITAYGEAKATDGKLRKLQEIRQRDLRELGFICEMIKYDEDITRFIQMVKNEIHKRS